MTESKPNTERALMDTRLLQTYLQIKYPDAVLLMGKHVGGGISNNVAFHYKHNKEAWEKDQLRMKQHIEQHDLSKNLQKGLYIFPEKILGNHFVVRDSEILKSFLKLAKIELERALLRQKILFILLSVQKTRKKFPIYTFFYHKLYDKNLLNLIMAFIGQNPVNGKLLFDAIKPVQASPSLLRSF